VTVPKYSLKEMRRRDRGRAEEAGGVFLVQEDGELVELSGQSCGG
jgi:hypothetical protein